MSRIEVRLISALSDNYAYLLRDEATNTTGVVDPSEANPVLKALGDTGWNLDYILNTHHHWDHTGGNLEVKQATGCKVVGSKIDRDRIPGIDIALGEGDCFTLGAAEAKIFDIPGHTRGHICFWFPESEALFSGDTLFTIGCGRVFEGTYEQMWNSLDKLRQLPDETKVYCGHEYTLKNTEFALTLEPNNSVLQAHYQEVQALRTRGQPTVPSTLAEEKACNPFLRPESKEIRSTLGLAKATLVDVFAAVRERKDHF